MCGISGPKYDTTIQDQMLAEAEAARKREEERQARIKTGLTSIDNTFAGFDDDFYSGRKSAFLDFYQPQIEDQFTDAKKQLTFGLARNGILNSTMAADSAGKLSKDYATNWASIVSKADADVNALKSGVANEKSALTAQLNATADADRVTNDALGRTQMLFETRPDYNPLGDIFSGVGDAFSNYNTAQTNRAVYDTYFGKKGGAPSSRVIY